MNGFVAKHTENETKSNNSGNTSKYDPSLDLPIALRKGTPYLIMCHTRISHYNSKLLLLVLALPQYPRVSTLPQSVRSGNLLSLKK